MAITSDKANMLCILNILEEYSDPDHILTTADIISKMDMGYDRKIDRRTISSAVEALNDFGFDISNFADNGKGYYLRERKYSEAEIKILIDSIYSCSYISRQETKELISKLLSELSVYRRKRYSYANIITAEKKSPNKQVSLNIEILDEAISEQKMVSFEYLDYDYDMTLKPRRQERYIVNPYSMVCDSGKYYLILIYKGQTQPKYYRIDMMRNIKKEEQTIEISKREAKLDNTKNVIFAHAGRPQRIELKCSKSVLRYVIEQFGPDSVINKSEDGSSFTAIVHAPTEGLIHWALQYLPSVEVISPRSTRDKIKEAIKNNCYGIK